MQDVQHRAGGWGDATGHRMIVIRTTYWLFVVFELMSFVPMLSPDLFAKVMGISDFAPGSDYRYAMGIAAVFTLGWVALMIWADRKPVERRGVMWLTIVPVLVGNLICGIYAATSGFVATAVMVPSWIVQVILIALFAYSHHAAGELDKGIPRR